MFFLFVIIVSIVLHYVDRALGLGGSTSSSMSTAGSQIGAGASYHAGVLGIIFSLATLIPGIAVGIRRLHDTDRSGWWLLIAFVPFIGALVLLVFFLLDGTSGPNRFGPDPKHPAPEGVF